MVLLKVMNKPPSRIRYEKSHPVITIRVSPDVYKRLQERGQAGQSYADILRIGLDKQEAYGAPLLKRIEELELEVLQTEELMEKRTVTYPCGRCGRLINVQSDKEKEVSREALIRAGFYHRSCPP